MMSKLESFGAGDPLDWTSIDCERAVSFVGALLDDSLPLDARARASLFAGSSRVCAARGVSHAASQTEIGNAFARSIIERVVPPLDSLPNVYRRSRRGVTAASHFGCTR